jgi:hypothetical protein
MGRYQAEMKARRILVDWPHAPVAGFDDWCRTSIGTDAERAVHASAIRAVPMARSRRTTACRDWAATSCSGDGRLNGGFLGVA